MDDSMDERDERWIRAMLEIGSKSAEARFNSIEKDITEVNEDVALTKKDYENRLRSLESFMWKAVGAAAIVGGIAGISASFLL